MTTVSPPASGPAILERVQHIEAELMTLRALIEQSVQRRSSADPTTLERLVQIEARFDRMTADAQAHWAREEERMRLVDQFINHYQPIDMLLVNVYDRLRSNTESKNAIERELRRLTGAIELLLSEPPHARACGEPGDGKRRG